MHAAMYHKSHSAPELNPRLYGAMQLNDNVWVVSVYIYALFGSAAAV